MKVALTVRDDISLLQSSRLSKSLLTDDGKTLHTLYEPYHSCVLPVEKKSEAH